MKIEIELPEETFRQGERLSRLRCLQSLEKTLGEFADDMAVSVNRLGSWEAAQVWGWLDSHYPPVEELRKMNREGGAS